MGDTGGIAVVNRTLAIPGFEHGLRGLLQLLERVSWKLPAGITADDFTEPGCNGFPGIGIQVCILLNL